MNYLKVSERLAEFTDPKSVGEYRGRIEAIGVLMQVLTFGLLVSFGAVAAKNAYVTARSTNMEDMRQRVRSLAERSRGDSAAPPVRGAEAAPKTPGRNLALEMSSYKSNRGAAATPASTARRGRELSVDVETPTLPAPAPTPPKTSTTEDWVEHRTENGKTYFYNAKTTETAWRLPASGTE